VNKHLPNSPLGFQQIQKKFSDAIRDPKAHSEVAGVDERHMNVYRELFFNNVEGFISGGFPVLMELLSKAQQTELVRDFFIKHACHSPYFLKISEEFLEYLLHCQLDFLPEFAYQLAHWEWMELHADVYQNTSENMPISKLNFEKDPVGMIESAWCQAYDYPVHQISAGNTCEAATSYLMVYRNQQLKVEFVALNPLSALLFQRLQDNQQLTADEILRDIATQQNMDINQVVQGGRQILQQWCDLQLLTLQSR